MEYLEKNYTDIKLIDEIGIKFINGDKILFLDCIGKRYNSKTCVAERDFAASPPYFEFFTPDKPTRIIFNKKGIFSKYQNSKWFFKLQMKINDMGYSSYDLS